MLFTRTEREARCTSRLQGHQCLIPKLHNFSQPSIGEGKRIKLQDQ